MDEIARPHNLNYFMKPRSVAIIGASRSERQGSLNLLKNMSEFGFDGKVYPVNPLADEIMGIKAYKGLKDIPGAVELVIIATPRDHVLKSVEDCARAGAKGVIIVSQGFADADEQGKAIQEELLEISRKKGMRILGPNTLGTSNAFSGFSSSFMPIKRTKIPVGVVCQSGVIFMGASSFSGIMGKGIDLGNSCDLDFSDALEYYGEDDETEVIFLHIEGIQQGRKFLEIAKKTALKKPIIALKTAKTESGAKAASSHSGSMAGDHAVFEAAFRQAGIISASNPEEVADYIKAFLHLPLIKGDRIGLITYTGGGGIVLIDSVERNGLKTAKFSPATIQKIKDLSPAWMPVGNPLDIWPAVMKYGLDHVVGEALSGALDDPGVDGVICTAIAPMLPDNSDIDATTVLRKTVGSHREKPVIVWLYGPNRRPVSRSLEENGKVMSVTSLSHAGKVLAALNQRRKFLKDSNRLKEV